MTVFMMMRKFQSTLLQEERPRPQKIKRAKRYFNPRSYKRSDKLAGFNISKNLISIHAPTRGATFDNLEIRKISDISIHAPTRGATRENMKNLSECKISIHAPTRGATSSILRSQKITLYFNPRSYKRSDLYMDCLENDSFISIHAPTRGATLHDVSEWSSIDISIHAPTRGATKHMICKPLQDEFQSTLLQEERRGVLVSFV